MFGRRLPRIVGAALVAATVVLQPLPATAHVKWFNDQYCVGCPPDTLDRIFDRWWLASLAFFSLLSLCAFVIDRIWGEQAGAWFEGFVAQIQSPPENYLRVGLGVFLLCLWVHGGILLTPELRTDNEEIAWLQLALAACTLSWRTTWITAAGIFTLYGIALAQYGVFHLLDYPIFPGIAAYLAIHSLRLERLRPLAGSILVAAVAATLLWASFEKWAYWSWTMPVIGTHPEIAMGTNPKAYVIFAGFVEFFLAYFLVAGRFMALPAAAGLLCMFVSAIFDFGKIDAIGHLMIILSLVVIILQGTQPVTNFLAPRRFGITLGAVASLAILNLVLGAYAVGYFGLHQLIYD